MQKKSLNELSIWDILILALILFGEATWSSTQLFLQDNQTVEVDLTVLSDAQYFHMFLHQGILLLLAFGYLFWRRFNFKQWRLAFNLKTIGQSIGLYVLLSILMDILFFSADASFRQYILAGDFSLGTGISAIFSQFLPGAVIYSLLNGFYEEIFFIGMCCFVKDKHRLPVFLFAMIVRIAFHTYQGILSALGIGIILSIIYNLYYKKSDQNLMPIFLSHAIADVLGLGLIQYFIN